MKAVAKPNDTLTIKRSDKENFPTMRMPELDRLFGFRPFNLMRRFNDLDRMFDRFNLIPEFNLDFPWTRENFNLPKMMAPFELPNFTELEKVAWWPEIEIEHKNGEMKVHADLPGMKKEDINVEFVEDALVISGERKLETKEEKEGFFRTERNYGNFYRRIPLPEGFDADKAKAVFHDGVLEINIAVPKLEPKARKLEISEKAPKAHAKAA